MHVFSGKIYKVGLIRFVDVPAKVSQAVGDGAVHVAVRGEVDGVAVQSTLVSRGKGCYRLAIHGDVRKKLMVDAGALVEVAIERDEEPREPVLPPALVFALGNSPKAQKVFRGMTTALRRQLVRYLTSAKRQETLERRAVKMARMLERRAIENRK